MKLLGAVRLSDLTEETTSPERQREAIAHTAIARADTLIETVEDLDVSGAVSPFDRAALRPVADSAGQDPPMGRLDYSQARPAYPLA